MRLTKVIIVNKFINLRLNFWTEIPKSQTTAKTKLPCRCSNSPILKRTLFQFYISHLNKKKITNKKGFQSVPLHLPQGHASSWRPILPLDIFIRVFPLLNAFKKSLSKTTLFRWISEVLNRANWQIRATLGDERRLLCGATFLFWGIRPIAVKHLRPAVAQRLIFKAANKEINSNVIKDLIESARIWTQRNAVFSLSLSHRRGNEFHSNWSFLIIIVDLQCPQKSLRGESLQFKL